MLKKSEHRSSDKRVVDHIKCMVTAISGALTTALIVCLGQFRPDVAQCIGSGVLVITRSKASDQLASWRAKYASGP